MLQLRVGAKAFRGQAAGSRPAGHRVVVTKTSPLFGNWWEMRRVSRLLPGGKMSTARSGISPK